MLRFFCACGHSRGRHEDCIKPKNEVGGCNSCKCNKYHSDKKRNRKAENHYVKVGLRIMLPPFTIILLTVILIDEIDYVFNGFSEFFFGIAFCVTFVYFTVLKPVEKLSNKIRSR